MTLAAPAAFAVALTLGLAGVLATYLLKLRRRPALVSTILFWPNAAHDTEVNIPLRALRATPLLLLHVLIVFLLALALGRPLLGDPAPPDRLILLIDRSASMSARDQPAGPTRLDQALAHARSVIDNRQRAASQPELTIIAFDSAPEVLLLASRHTPDALRALASITPTDLPGRPEPALDLARSIATAPADAADATTNEIQEADDADDAPAPRAALLWLTDAPAAPLLRRLLGSQTAPTADTTAASVWTPPEPTRPPATNVGITALAARRDPQSPSTALAQVTLTHTAAQPVTIALSWSLNGLPIGQRALTLPPNQPLTLTIPIDAPAGGLLRLALTPEDALAADDTAALALDPPRPPRVTWLRPATAGPPNAFMLATLQALTNDTLDVRAIDPADLSGQLAAPNAATNTATSTAGPTADALVIESLPLADLPALPSLLLAAAPPTLLAPSPASPAAFTSPAPILTWDREHPVLRYLSLDTLEVSRGFWLPDDLPTPHHPADAYAPLARGPRGPLIASLTRGTTRHLILGFTPADSTWSFDAGLAIFLADALAWLTSTRDDVAAAPIATPLTLRSPPPAGSTPAPLTLRGPIDRGPSIPPITRAATPDAAGLAAPGLLPHAGVYTLTNATRPVAAVALLDPAETAIHTPQPAQDGGQPAEAAATARDRASLTAAVSNLFSRDLWPLCLLAAFALLTIEWFAFALTARR